MILDSLAPLSKDRHFFVRLEDLAISSPPVQALFEFLKLSYRDEYFRAFTRPHNVNRPEDHLLVPEQRAAFDRLAAPMMERLGYAERAEYVVNY